MNKLDQELIYASRDGKLELVKELVEKGANIHVWNNYALIFAIRKGHLEVAKYLEEQINRSKLDNE